MSVSTHEWQILMMYGLVALMAIGLTLYATHSGPRRTRRKHAR